MHRSNIFHKSSSIIFGFTEEQLQAEIINNNNQAMLLLQNGNINKVQSILTETNKLLSKIKFDSMIQKRVKCMTLNSWAFYYHYIKQNENALQIIDKAITIEQQITKDKLSMARTYLNKSVILSSLNKHEQSLLFANKAIYLLQKQKNCVANNRKRKQNLSEMFVISFYNIAAEFQFLNKNEDVIDTYNQGYNLCKQIMGQKHKLTILMKKNLNQKSLYNKQQSLEVNNIKELNDGDKLILKFSKKFQHKKFMMYRKHLKNKSISNTRSQHSNNKLEYRISDHNKLLQNHTPKHISQILTNNHIISNNQQQDEMKHIQHIKKIYMPQRYKRKMIFSPSKHEKYSKTIQRQLNTKSNVTQQSLVNKNQSILQYLNNAQFQLKNSSIINKQYPKQSNNKQRTNSKKQSNNRQRNNSVQKVQQKVNNKIQLPEIRPKLITEISNIQIQNTNNVKSEQKKQCILI